MKGKTGKASAPKAKMMYGGGMAKAKMQKVATKAVKGHEARMHKGAKKMAYGGMAKMRTGGRCK